MKQNKEIPTGYKDSQLGIIPESWKIKRLGEIGKIYSGGTPDTDNPLYWNGEINWCTPTDITALNGNKYIGNTITKITTEGLNNSSAKLLPPNSIIVCTRASIGKTVISKFNIATNQGFKNIVPNENVDTPYLYYVVSNSETKLLKLGSGSTFLEVSKNDFENLKFAFPPILEQVKIAQILSLWDNAIEKQKILVEKLERRKRGLMQQLLSGEKRLSGFPSQWKSVKLGDSGEFIKGFGVPKDKIINSGQKAITYGEIYTKHNIIIKCFTSFIDEKTASQSQLIEKGDILFAGSGETLEDIGKCVAYIDDDCAFAGGDIIIYKPKLINSIVLSYILNSPCVIKQKRQMGQGHSIVHIYAKSLSKIKVNLPSIEEQNSIAKVLMNIDKEIDIVKERLASIRTQKNGLMLQLLTGKRRVRI